jgi:hypothetical protein
VLQMDPRWKTTYHDDVSVLLERVPESAQAELKEPQHY